MSLTYHAWGLTKSYYKRTRFVRRYAPPSRLRRKPKVLWDSRWPALLDPPSGGSTNTVFSYDCSISVNETPMLKCKRVPCCCLNLATFLMNLATMHQGRLLSNSKTWQLHDLLSPIFCLSSKKAQPRYAKCVRQVARSKRQHGIAQK